MAAAKAKRVRPKRRPAPHSNSVAQSGNSAPSLRGPTWAIWLAGIAAAIGLAWGVGSVAGVLSRPAENAARESSARSAHNSLARASRRDALDTYRPPASYEGLKEESFETAADYLRRFPGDVDGLAKAAQLAGIFGEKELAVRHWQQCVELMPVSMQAWYALAWLAMNDAQWQEMAGYARRALQIMPDADQFRDLLGYALIELGQTEEAIQVLNTSVERGRASCDTYTLLGKVHLLQRDYEQAVTCYEQAVALDPQWTKALYGLGTANARLGRREAARNALQRFRESQKSVVVKSSAEELEAVRHDVALIYRGLAELYDRRGVRTQANRLLYQSEQFELPLAADESTGSLHHMSGRISDTSSDQAPN